jgi:hypothetical protein
LGRAGGKRRKRNDGFGARLFGGLLRDGAQTARVILSRTRFPLDVGEFRRRIALHFVEVGLQPF